MDEIYLKGTKYVNRGFDINGFFSAYKFDWDDKYSYKGESHNPWEIVFVKSGKIEATEDENVYVLEKNNLIIHAPMEFHAIRSVAPSNPSVCIFSFYAVGELPEELKNGIFTLNDSDADEFKTTFEKIYNFYCNSPENIYAGQEAADRLSAFLIRLSRRTARDQISISPTAIEYHKIASAMAQNVCENLSLGDFADMCSVSVSYIKLLFKKYATLSPMSYYANLRIQRAITFMRQGLSAWEIANKMNFSSPNYFSVFFKKQTGESPSVYRRRLK